MPKYSLKQLKFSRLDILLFVIYLGLFGFFIFQHAIYSPDTNTYFRLHFYRFPGYGIFLRIFDLLFGSFFDFAVVAFQLAFGFVSIHLLSTNLKQFLKLGHVVYFLLLAILIFPYFPPLLVGNNLSSEGLSYPLYLLLITFALDFLFREKYSRIIHLSVVFVLLCLTRGQFIIVAPILAFIYILKERKRTVKKTRLYFLVVLLLLPFAAQGLDRTYHKLVHGFFVTTPFSYVNALTLPLYVSDSTDAEQLKTLAEKELFLNTYKAIDSMGLLSSKVSGGARAKYGVFHNNFPWICNRNFHVPAMHYFEDKAKVVGENVILTEKAAKEMIPILVKNNFKEYISLYLEGIFHGFKGILVSVSVFLLLLYSLANTLKKWSVANGFLLMALLLIVSNAMIVAFASHSIMRYLFYNYFFAVLVGIVIFRKIFSRS